jgi:hypothetical protein
VKPNDALLLFVFFKHAKILIATSLIKEEYLSSEHVRAIFRVTLHCEQKECGR